MCRGINNVSAVSTVLFHLLILLFLSNGRTVSLRMVLRHTPQLLGQSKTCSRTPPIPPFSLKNKVDLTDTERLKGKKRPNSSLLQSVKILKKIKAMNPSPNFVLYDLLSYIPKL